MLAIIEADEDQQPAAVTAVFDALQELGPAAAPDDVTQVLLELLVGYGATSDDLDDLLREGVVEPWAPRAWELMTGRRIPEHRPHPAELQTGPVLVIEDQRLTTQEPRIVSVPIPGFDASLEVRGIFDGQVAVEVVDDEGRVSLDGGQTFAETPAEMAERAEEQTPEHVRSIAELRAAAEALAGRTEPLPKPAPKVKRGPGGRFVRNK